MDIYYHVIKTNNLIDADVISIGAYCFDLNSYFYAENVEYEPNKCNSETKGAELILKGYTNKLEDIWFKLDIFNERLSTTLPKLNEDAIKYASGTLTDIANAFNNWVIRIAKEAKDSPLIYISDNGGQEVLKQLFWNTKEEYYTKQFAVGSNLIANVKHKVVIEANQIFAKPSYNFYDLSTFLLSNNINPDIDRSSYAEVSLQPKLAIEHAYLTGLVMKKLYELNPDLALATNVKYFIEQESESLLYFLDTYKNWIKFRGRQDKKILDYYIANGISYYNKWPKAKSLLIKLPELPELKLLYYSEGNIDDIFNHFNITSYTVVFQE